MDWVNIGIIGNAVGQWMAASATTAAAHIAALPTGCWSSIVHAGSTCVGARPHSFPTPGFAPFPLCWGWFLLGLGIGMSLVTIYFSHLYSRPSDGNHQHVPHRPVSPLLMTHTTRHAEWTDSQYEFLQHIIAGGPPLLREVAQHSQRDPADIIMSILFPPQTTPTTAILDLLPPSTPSTIIARPSRRT